MEKATSAARLGRASCRPGYDPHFQLPVTSMPSATQRCTQSLSLNLAVAIVAAVVIAEISLIYYCERFSNASYCCWVD